jgi:hypothetical protein
MRTLLLLPLLVAASLLVAFPKLVTGDFIDVTVDSVDEVEQAITFGITIRSSNETGCALSHGTAMRGTWGDRISSGENDKPLLPTWPTKEKREFYIGIKAAELPGALPIKDLKSIVRVEVGHTYRVTPGHPLTMAAVNRDSGKQCVCLLSAYATSGKGF